jgi:hypothetical protein
MVYRFGLICTLVFALPFTMMSQPANYWTNTFNTEASLLSGAVVGGNAEITAIYYNPAGISDVKTSRIELNASLFSLEQSTYKNPLGKGTKIDNLNFRFYPRFVSYLYPSNKDTSFTIQFAVFNRNHKQIDLYDRIKISNSGLIFKNLEEEYTGRFSLKSKYDDYWGSIGISKRINENLSVGISLNVSVQSFSYFRWAVANAIPTSFPEDTLTIISANWSVYERQKAYNWRFIGKIGILYKKNNWSLGANLSLPSLRLFGNADVDKSVSQSNIFYNDEKLPDYYKNEYAQKVYFKMQDPLSLSVGIMLKEPHTKSDYFLTLEYFYKIDNYHNIDATRTTNKNSKTTSVFTSYEFGNRGVLNIALGYKKMLSESLGILAGFRTDLNPYKIGYKTDIWGSNSYENLNNNLYHLTGGLKFDYKKSSFIVGLQYSYGFKKNQSEFVNFSEPNAYNPETGLALQGIKNNNSKYSENVLGFYLGFSVSF